MARAFQQNATKVGVIEESGTIAEGICVRQPSHGVELLRAFQSGLGAFEMVAEEDILPARSYLARQGISVEPTSAVVWQVLEKWLKKLPEPIVLIMSGSGLKYG